MIDIQAVKLNTILKNAERFVEKHDYLYRGSIFEDEARAWQDAIEVLRGSKRIYIFSDSLNILLQRPSNKQYKP